MIIPMRCFTCNEPLSNLWEYYHKKVVEMEKKRESSETNQETYKNFDKQYKKKILDELELDNMCCRRHLLGHVDLIEII